MACFYLSAKLDTLVASASANGRKNISTGIPEFGLFTN